VTKKVIKGRKGNQPHIPTKETRNVVLTGRARGMTQVEIAEFMGVTDRTLRNHYKDELRTGKYAAVKQVADKLFKIAMDEDPSTISQQLAASIFILKTQGGWREVNRTEITGKDGGAIQIEASRAVLDPRDMSPEAREEFRTLLEGKMAEIEQQDAIDGEYEEVEDGDGEEE
jgi:hypothetical protein